MTVLTPKETGRGGNVYVAPIARAALCESGFSSSGAVAEAATLALGFKPSAVDTAYPLCDPTSHYLLTIRKAGTSVTVWKQGIALGGYTTTATTYAGLLTEALTTYAGAAKGYVSRLAVVEDAVGYDAFYALSPSVSGLWVPKALSGLTPHTLLDFNDAVDLGHDSSGNGNHWTLTNAMQSVDTPTNNCATLNPLGSVSGSIVFSDGMLSVLGVGSGEPWSQGVSTLGATGKTYWEAELVALTSQNEAIVGVLVDPTGITCAGYPGIDAGGWGIRSTLTSHLYLYHAGTSTDLGYWGPTSAGDVYCIAVDPETGSVWVRRNNEAWVGGGDPENGSLPTFSITPGTAFMAASLYSSGNKATVDFGQNGYAYQPPAGFSSLSSASLPEPTVLDESKFYHVSLFTATSSEQNIEVGFDAENEDWLMILKGLGTQPWKWINTVCGLDKFIDPAVTAGEGTLTTPVAVSGSTITIPADILSSGVSYSVMVIKAGADTGLDIVTYTGDGSSPQMVDHSLGQVPFMFAVFGRSDSSDKSMYWELCGADKRIDLSNSTGQVFGVWGGVAPTATQFALGGGYPDSNANGSTYVAFLFGYSDILTDYSYLANGSIDGPFVAIDGAVRRIEFLHSRDYSHWWNNADIVRNPNNPVNRTLLPHDDASEQIINSLIFTSAGFKVASTHTTWNSSGETIIGMVLKAQNKYSNAF